MDLRERVLADCDDAGKTRAVATKYRVSESWVRRFPQTRRDGGQVAPRPHAGGRTPGRVAHADAVRAAVAAAPDATPAEYRQRFTLPPSRSALARARLALGLSHQKRRPGRPSRTARTGAASGPNGGPPGRPSTRPGGRSWTRRGPARP